MIKFNEDIMGCPLRSSYSVTKNPATRQHPTLRGRSRHELKDTEAVHKVNLAFDMSASQFASWQLFWDAVGRGADWFLMDLTLSDPTITEHEVHATKPFQAQQQPNLSWTVTLELEAVPVP